MARLTVASTLAGLLAVVSAAGANGDIYRWVDENGQVHYSNVPSRMQSREEPVVVPLPSEPSPPSEVVVPQEGEGEEAMVPPPDAPVSDVVPPDIVAPDMVAPDAVSPGTAPSDARPVGTPAQNTLARISMERDYRQSRRRLNEIDRELTNLAEARTRFAVEGPASVGGLPTVDAPDVRSEEELVLEKEREALVKHLEGIRGRYNTLRGQVAAQHGGEAPAAWRELP
jgi:hypothetical protein